MTAKESDEYWNSLQAAADSVDHRMTREEETLTNELFEALSPEEREALADRSMPLRHLRAEKGDLPKAIAALRRTLKWRQEFQVRDIQKLGLRKGADVAEEEKKEEDEQDAPAKASLEELARVIRKENETGKLYVRGYDRDGRAVLYMRPGKENTNHEEGNMRHLVYHMEKSIACSAKNGRSKMCIVIDYDGFSLRQAPPMSTSKYTLDVLQKHYPERLHRAYICNPPWIFKGFWKVISPFIDPVTKQKIQFCTSPKDFEKVIQDMGGKQKAERYLEVCAGGTLQPTDFDTEVYLSLPLDVSLGEQATNIIKD